MIPEILSKQYIVYLVKTIHNKALLGLEQNINRTLVFQNLLTYLTYVNLKHGVMTFRAKQKHNLGIEHTRS